MTGLSAHRLAYQRKRRGSAATGPARSYVKGGAAEHRREAAKLKHVSALRKRLIAYVKAAKTEAADAAQLERRAQTADLRLYVAEATPQRDAIADALAIAAQTRADADRAQARLRQTRAVIADFIDLLKDSLT